MEKFLQAIVLICGLVGSILAYTLLGSERQQEQVGDSLFISEKR